MHQLHRMAAATHGHNIAGDNSVMTSPSVLRMVDAARALTGLMRMVAFSGTMSERFDNVCGQIG